MQAAAPAFGRAAALAGRRSVATFAIMRAPEAMLQDLWGGSRDDAQPAASDGPRSQRAATAAIARRQQWQTVPMHDCPKTLPAAMQEPCAEARIITEIAPPHKVVFANASWERLCGWQASEVTGRSGLAFIQGPDTDPVTVQHINAAVKNGERVHVQVLNYKKDGSPFLNNLRITPLRSAMGAKLTHVLGILEEVKTAPGLTCQLQQHGGAGSSASA